MGNNGLSLAFQGNCGFADVTDENYGWLAVDVAMDGNGSLSYPQPPTQNGPDELLTIDGLALTTSSNWSLRLAGIHPVGNWDQYADRRTADDTDDDKRWPLFTVYGNADNWIQLIANCQDRSFRVIIRRSGTTLSPVDFGAEKQFWLQDAPLMVAMGYNASTSKLAIGASLGGDEVRIMGAATVPFGATLDQLRFRAPPAGGISGDGEVVEFRWLGGEIEIGGTPLNDTTLPTAFASLTFLDGPPP